MPDDIVIFGAGLAGLIAANMLTHNRPVVYEKQESLPNNHSAVLRFRSNVVSLATNIDFKKVKVIKAVHESVNPVHDAVSYSMKVTGKLQSRSVIDTDTVERYIAPEDFVSRLAMNANIEFGVDFLEWTNNLWSSKRDTTSIISTLPMPFMMETFGWKDIPDFTYIEGWNIKAILRPKLRSELNATMYYPGREPYYRSSICGSEILIEGVGPFPTLQDQMDIVRMVCSSFGLRSDHVMTVRDAKPSKYQKIADLNRAEHESAKRFMMWLSRLGRFATWRPKLLLDDLVQDVSVIKGLINENHY